MAAFRAELVRVVHSYCSVVIRVRGPLLGGLPSETLAALTYVWATEMLITDISELLTLLNHLL